MSYDDNRISKSSSANHQSGPTVCRNSVFVDPPNDFAAERDINMLKGVARELGDEWMSLGRLLNVSSTRLQNILRRAETEGLDDEQVKMEMLACWFKAQPRATDKVGPMMIVLHDDDHTTQWNA